MVFNSLTFLIFFTGVLILHRLPLPWTAKKVNLLVASWVFYAAWNPPFIVLLWISTVLDWICAKRIAAAATPTGRRAWLLVSVVAGFGMLGLFKYGSFIENNAAAVLGLLGIDWQPRGPDLVLPPGISFYTFQTLSYTIDVYRRRSTPSSSFLDYALYVAFFPQLVAGPIVRAGDFLPQCERPQPAGAAQVSWGLSLLVLGLAEKVVLADSLLAPVVDSAYGGPSPGPLGAWAGTLAFAGQIFFDFSGYSTAAIGVAMALGFVLPDNFRFPYAALGFSDFWRRWHVSLSTWLRDYVYIPLGGNRHGPAATSRNLMLTMLLGGLWHGAAWTFVIWGGLHGLYLLAERAVRPRLDRALWTQGPVAKLAGIALTFALVNLAWVFFRSRSFQQAWDMLGAMAGAASPAGTPPFDPTSATLAFGVTAGLLCGQIALRGTDLESLASRTPWWARGLVLGGALVALVVSAEMDRAFIYFQF